MAPRLVLMVLPRRPPAGQLRRASWAALSAGPVLCADPDHPQRTALVEQGVAVEVCGPLGPDAVHAVLGRRARPTGAACWLLTGDTDPLAAALAGRPGVEILTDAADPPGAALLSAVATMDRLRSPGGCPWDAAQTHQSLTGYLLEEAYEAVEAVEDGDLERGLAEELGDVLLQVLFHARIAAERAEGGFDIDVVSDGLVTKLVRRHPHVFDPDGAALDPAAVELRWEEIKQAEKGRRSVLDGVPTGQPALAYAGAVLRRAARARLAPPAVAATGTDPVTRWGRRLLAEAARCQAAGVDPEAALRAANRELAAGVRAAEARAGEAHTAEAHTAEARPGV